MLAGLSKEVVRELVDGSHVLTCDRGDDLIQVDSRNRTLFVVLEGFVEIRVGGRLVAVRTRGDVIGEVAFLLDTPRMAGAMASPLARNDPGVLARMTPLGS